MNCFKVIHENNLNTAAAEKDLPAAVDFSVHGIGISILQNKFFVFGL